MPDDSVNLIVAGRWRCFPISKSSILEGLEGRVRSSSYTPLPVTPEGEAMLHDLRLLFAECQERYYGVLSVG